MEIISSDNRHNDVTVIIRESISERAFSNWTMGFALLYPDEADRIIGTNDFFTKGKSFAELGEGRTKRILSAFKKGSWRTRLSDKNTPEYAYAYNVPEVEINRENYSFTFGFQPIIDIKTGFVFSYEALIRGLNNESAGEVFKNIEKEKLHAFDEECRKRAIYTASKLGIRTKLNINFLPMSIDYSKTAISSILDAAEENGLKPEQIVLEVLESEIIADIPKFSAMLDLWRPTGMILAIDDFGSGNAGLNLLADFQPDILKLDMDLIRNIHSNGPRQAIVRGVERTCDDLGIDIIAEGVETKEEYDWLRNEGIYLYQGNLFAEAQFEKLLSKIQLP